jgi:hypothetical protein
MKKNGAGSAFVSLHNLDKSYWIIHEPIIEKPCIASTPKYAW